MLKTDRSKRHSNAHVVMMITHMPSTTKISEYLVTRTEKTEHQTIEQGRQSNKDSATRNNYLVAFVSNLYEEANELHPVCVLKLTYNG